jgi:Flp pilus assembly protein CpaB
VNSARLFLYRFRRPLAAASAALAVLLLAGTLRPTAPDRIDLVVVASDLPSGARLAEADLEVRSVAVEAVSPGSLSDLDEAIGRTLVGPIAAGEVLTSTRLLDAQSRGDGVHLVPVRLSDPESADLLTPGTLVDLVRTAGDLQGRVVAEGVRVVTVPRRTRDSGLGGASMTASSLIVVATDRRTAIALAAAGSQAGVGVVMR